MVNKINVKIGEVELVFETGKMARQANGSVLVTCGGSAVLATVCCGNTAEDLDYVPLQVEYNEKYYAAGKIPGGFLKREGRPKDKEILVSRLIDRPMRPLFDKKFKREIQVVPTTVSTDMVNPPDIIGMIASSAAVAVSDIPFAGPIGAVRVCAMEDDLIVNPTFEQIAKSRMDIVVAGTDQGITMVEGGASEVGEDLLLKAIDLAAEAIKKLCEAQNQLVAAAGKPKLPLPEAAAEPANKQEIIDYAEGLLKDACFVKGKMERQGAIKEAKKQVFDHFKTALEEENGEKNLNAFFEEAETQVVRQAILKNKTRTDGRGLTDIRPITCEISVLPRTHGSALFTRGETQSLAITTFGTVMDEQMRDDIDGDIRYERFMLHYNFPPFSVGETGRLSTGRREIGHGHLAHRAIEGVLPAKEKFPYTIRVVSEILESNGSSSMASVCGGALSLLNAGVPLKKPVAGIAMGLISGDGQAAVLSDILGEEDHLGDMDFKVAGTKDGITAFQMDIKISGISPQIMATALEQARVGRLHILEIMNQTIAEPRQSLSEFAPRIITMKIDPDKIGGIIGSGGKTVKSISEATGSNINIENDGKITIFCRRRAGAEEAQSIIKELIEEPRIGKIYQGKVKKIMDFGAFIEFLPGREGLCHISKLSRQRINAVRDVLTEEQEIPVKMIDIDRMGRYNLSYIDALEEA